MSAPDLLTVTAVAVFVADLREHWQEHWDRQHSEDAAGAIGALAQVQDYLDDLEMLAGGRVR